MQETTENQEKLENPEKVAEKTDFQVRHDAFFEKLKALSQEYKVDFNISIDFPEYKVLPDELQLALMVMGKHKNRFILGLKDMEVQDGNKS